MHQPDPSLPPTLHREAARLAALHEPGVLDTAPDREFDVMTRLAADSFASDVSLVATEARLTRQVAAIEALGDGIAITDSEGLSCS